ncbi:hypothetical protein JYU16_00295 [bacterium AH-315-M05]|nr:hypothetical protein [bacterium AH-315-M05]
MKILIVFITVLLISKFGIAQNADSLTFDIGEVTYVDSNLTEDLHAFIVYSYIIDRKGLPADIRFEKEECETCTKEKMEEIKQMIVQSLNSRKKVKGWARKANKNIRSYAGYKYNVLRE